MSKLNHLKGFNQSDLSKEIEVFSDAKEAMIGQVLDTFDNKLTGKDLILLRVSLERTWDNGFRYGFSSNFL